MKPKRGFTVIEILIVVIILAMLAAIAVPRFSQASSQARLSDMVSNIQKVRSQLALYKIQHDDLLPGQTKTEDKITEAAFVQAMTTRSDDGCGPYLKKMPVNPFSNSNSITFVDDLSAVPMGNEGTGWWLNSATGDFRACDNSFHAVY